MFPFRYITLLLFNVDVLILVSVIPSAKFKVVLNPALVGSLVYGDVCEGDATELSDEILLVTVIE